MFKLVIFTIFISVAISKNNYDVGQNQSRKFPPGFLFGAGSAAIQVEGAWNEDGKGPSGWDYYQLLPGVVMDNSTAHVACDSYHLSSEDIPYLKMAGMNAYRFSLSWPRLLPNASTDNVNQKAVDYYNGLISEVLSYNMTPVVTMYHWDLPQNLTELGGWTNVDVIEAFVSYAEFLLKTFGDRVKHWITMNEPNMECIGGYGSVVISPGMNKSGTADYKCGHYKLLAHARAYQRFKQMPGAIKDGAKMGFSIAYTTYFPWDSSNTTDHEAANLAFEFFHGWFINPVFGTGGYPRLMRKVVDSKSRLEGLKESRLPRFTPAQVAILKGSADFLGINQYSGLFSSFVNHCPTYLESRYFIDVDAFSCPKPGYTTTYNNFSQVIPGSMKKALTDVRTRYNNPPIMITENGYPDGPDENLVENPQRESFFQEVLSEVLDSIADGSNVLSYVVWSLLDSFEWNSGYMLKFGSVHVDFSDVNRTRTAKPIINFFRNFAEYGLNVTDTLEPRSTVF